MKQFLFLILFALMVGACKKNSIPPAPYVPPVVPVVITPPTLSTIAITEITEITDSAATTGGNISADGGAAVTARGVCWGLMPAPSLSGNHTSDSTGTGTF